MGAYSFLDVQAAIVGPGGQFSLGSGAGAAEEGITVSMAEEKGTTTTGADGQIMQSLHAGNTGSVAVRLLKTSPVNALLSQLYNFQRQNSGAWGVNVITVTDVQRGDVVSAVQMAFVKQPDLAYAKDGNTVEWMFRGIVVEELGAGIPDVNT